MKAIQNTAKTDLIALQDLQELALDYAVRSKADRTRRAYDSDWSDFEGWAGLQGLETRPARPEAVALYISYLARAGLKVSTIQRRLVAISQKHKASGYETPTKNQLVRSTMAGIRRAHGVAAGAKSPLLTHHLQTWVSGLSDGLRDRRDKAIVLLGFAGAFRRSELAALDREDIALTPQGLVVTIRKSKTDQEGAGRRVGIPFGRIVNGEPGQTCPVAAVMNWIHAAGIESGPLFRRIRRGGHLQAYRLSDKAIAGIVKRLCQAVGISPEEYSGHSLRAGHATQATMSGAEEIYTIRQTGHKSTDVFRRYVRDADLFTNSSAAKLGL